MASVLNTVLGATGNMGEILPANWKNNWEDVDQWNFAVITVNSPVNLELTVQWANTERGSFPNTADKGEPDNDVIAEEKITVVGGDDATTIAPDHRGRWFRVNFKLNEQPGNEQVVNLSVNYKTASSLMKIGDETSVTTIGGTGDARVLQIVASDDTGLKLSDTGSATGNALYVNLRGSDEVQEIAITTDVGAEHSLLTAITDANGLAISTLADTTGNSVMYTVLSNSDGVEQATTGTITGANTDGVASFLALGDNSGSQVTSLMTANKTDFTGNSAYVALCSSGGRIHGIDNPLYMDISAAPTEGVNAFDIPSGLTVELTSVAKVSAASLNLFNLFVYNDGATTAWVKIYDMNEAEAAAYDTYEDMKERLIQNIACGAKSVRDITFPHGITFSKGLYFRSTVEHGYGSDKGPAPTQIFVNGIYINFIV